MLNEWVEHFDGVNDDEEILDSLQSDEAGAASLQAQLDGRPSNGPPESEELPLPTTWLFDPDTFAPASKIVGDKHYSIITDHLGTPLSMYDEKGVQTWAAELDIYGTVKNLQGEKSDCPFRYPGQYEDGETGLYYNLNRYYDSESGFYISQDPIGLEGGIDLYSYVGDVLLWFDPFGLNVQSGAGRDHVTYRVVKNGKPYTGYASAPSNLGLSPEEIISRRYNGDFIKFNGTPPKPVCSGSGVQENNTARRLEQHFYLEDAKKYSKMKVAKKQNPVGPCNKKTKCIKAAQKHLGYK
jgi:RHS repeat-associated protein